jgi:hypothetical protein
MCVFSAMTPGIQTWVLADRGMGSKVPQFFRGARGGQASDKRLWTPLTLRGHVNEMMTCIATYRALEQLSLAVHSIFTWDRFVIHFCD